MAANAEIIRAFGEARGLTRADLAELFGVSEATIGSWFRSPSSAAFRNPPDAYVKLVKYMQDAEQFRANRLADCQQELATLAAEIPNLPDTVDGVNVKAAFAALERKLVARRATNG